MFYLLHKPLKILQEKSEIYKIFKVTGKQFDHIKNTILEVKKQSIITSATGKYLDLQASDRNMIRYENEKDEDFRRRLIYKFEVEKLAGTKQGILLGLQALNYNVSVVSSYLIENEKENWAEFYVVIKEDILKNNYSFNVIKQTVMEVKQASAKPNFCFNYSILNVVKNDFSSLVAFNFKANFWGDKVEDLYLNGSIILNGLYELHGTKSTDYIFLDGSSDLIGSYKLEAVRFKEKTSTIKQVNLTISYKNFTENNQKFKIFTNINNFLDGTYDLIGSVYLNSEERIEEI